MAYKITKRQRDNARRLGVEIRPSTSPGKKIDVIKDGKRIASVGASGYADYDIYLKSDSALAQKRRRLYKIRHEKNRKKPGTPGYYADKILW
jgi:hypothetical protein